MRVVSFTGSTEVGREIARVAGDRIAPVLLELGGKSPAIVYPDSDTDATAEGVITGMRFTRQGQGCSAGSRLFVHRDVFTSFLDRLVAALEELRIGDPVDEATDVGSLISRKQFDRVCGYLHDGLDHGATTVVGGLPDPGLPPGWLVRPTIFTDVDPSGVLSLGQPLFATKASGFGREHSLEAALDDFTYRKNVVVGLGRP